MFRFTRKPSSGSHRQYLAKITHLVKSGYVELVQNVVSVMAAYCDLCALCEGIPSHSARYTRLTDHNMQP